MLTENDKLAYGLKEIFESQGYTKPLVVHGKSSFYFLWCESIVDSFLGDSYDHFYDFSPNPKFEESEKCLDEIRGNKYDVILAIGGGSVMDMAKLIAFRLASDSSAPSILIDKDYEFHSDIVPIIAVPTTSGTGSEATHFAVVYYKNTKYSLAHEGLLPSHVILDV